MIEKWLEKIKRDLKEVYEQIYDERLRGSLLRAVDVVEMVIKLVKGGTKIV